MCLPPEFDMFWTRKNHEFFGTLNYCKIERKKRLKTGLIKYPHLCVYVLNLDIFKIFSMYKQVLGFAHFPNNSVFSKFVSLGGLSSVWSVTPIDFMEKESICNFCFRFTYNTDLYSKCSNSVFFALHGQHILAKIYFFCSRILMVIWFGNRLGILQWLHIFHIIRIQNLQKLYYRYQKAHWLQYCQNVNIQKMHDQDINKVTLQQCKNAFLVLRNSSGWVLLTSKICITQIRNMKFQNSNALKIDVHRSPR